MYTNTATNSVPASSYSMCMAAGPACNAEQARLSRGHRVVGTTARDKLASLAAAAAAAFQQSEEGSGQLRLAANAAAAVGFPDAVAVVARAAVRGFERLLDRIESCVGSGLGSSQAHEQPTQEELQMMAKRRRS